MSAGALQSAIDALYRDSDTIVLTRRRWFETLLDSVRYADARPKVERYYYGPLTQILSTYAATIGDAESEATLVVIPQGWFEASMAISPFKTEVKRQSPDVVLTILKKNLNAEITDYGKALLPGWLEAKPLEESNDQRKADADEVRPTNVEGHLEGHTEALEFQRISKRVSRDLAQLCKQAFFAFHNFDEDVLHAILIYGMIFYCFRFIRPANWDSIQGNESECVGSPEPVHSNEDILLGNNINPRFLQALHLMTGPLNLPYQPSWFRLPPDYSDSAPGPDLSIAKKAIELYETPEIPGESSPEQPEKKQDGEDSYILSSANSTDTVGSQFTGPTPSRKPNQRGRTRHASPDDSPLLHRGKLKSMRPTGRTRLDAPNSDHREGFITLHIPVRSRTNAGTLSGPDRIIKRMRNREGVLPPADKGSKAAADGAQKSKPGARKSRKRGRSDDADLANDDGQMQRKIGREKRPRFAQKPVADNGHASTSHTQDEGPAAAITLGYADTGHAEPATVPSQDAQEPVEPGTSHAVMDTQSATQQGEEVSGHGGVVLHKSTRNKKAR
ncbi:hypothetical protein EWM64_g5759 [Hericium alpestre]|uniref:Uncharacterized protein n=1 Tax=Hericium alpestre TaxID=135208 RepID=A0A4Y9ZW22_9AGAM|nr:hypothetical protein EWM64_g5759 [Hericium alpestre]